MNKARSSFCDYSVSSGKCHESNTSRKTSSDYHTLDNFCRLLFLHFLGQKSPASLQCVLIVLSRNWFSSPSHLSNTSRWFAASFSRYPVSILTSGIHLLLESQSSLTLSAATILQLLILHLPGKKCTPGVTWLQILWQDFSHHPVANWNVLARFQCK